MALSPELKDAVNHVQSHAEGMRAVLTIADEIDKIGTLETLATEAERRKAAADADVSAVQGHLKEVEAKADKAKADITKAKEQAKQIVADANEKAAGIIAKAQADASNRASEILTEVQSRKDVVLKEIEDEIERLEGIKADVSVETDKLRGLRSESAEVTQRADEAKAYLSKLTGG